MQMPYGILFAAILTIGGTAFAQTWPNEPAGSTQLSDFNFSAKTGNGWSAVYPTLGDIASDPTAPGSPPSVLHYSWNHNTTGNASTTNFYFPNGGTNSYYIGFWWKPSSPFTGWGTGQNKINLIQSEPNGHIYLLFTGAQGGPYSLMFTTTWPSYSGVSNAHLAGPSAMCDAGGICNLFSNVGGGGVSLGQWQRVEYIMKMSTTTTSRDGIIRWWMNGKLAGNYTKVNTPNTLFNQVQFAPVWDHAEPSYPNAFDQHWFDHVRLSKPSTIPSVLMISTLSVTGPRAGLPYSFAMAGEGGKTPYTWVVSSGSLPAGLTLNSSTGVISGTALSGGKSSLTIKLLDSSTPAVETSRSYSMVVSGGIQAIERGNALTGTRTELAIAVSANSAQFDLANLEPNAGFSLLVYDLAGRTVWNHTGLAKATAATAKWNFARTSPKGAYVVKMQQGTHVVSARFCVVR